MLGEAHAPGTLRDGPGPLSLDSGDEDPVEEAPDVEVEEIGPSIIIEESVR